MAKPKKKNNREITLGDDFGPAVVRLNGLTITTDANGNVKLENGPVTVDIVDDNASVFGGNVTAHTDGTVQLKAPAPEQTNAPDVITSSFGMIRAGTVQLNKISQYLADLPDTATAELLVSPRDLANIDGGGLDTWVNSIKRIRNIRGYHGLDGMAAFDRPETASDVTYEEAWADQIKTAFSLAASSGQEITTGLFMPTKELVNGRRPLSGHLTVETNLYSKRNEIGKQGDPFITKNVSKDAANWKQGADWQWTSTEHLDNPSRVYDVAFAGAGTVGWESKDNLRLSARPVALALQP